MIVAVWIIAAIVLVRRCEAAVGAPAAEPPQTLAIAATACAASTVALLARPLPQALAVALACAALVVAAAGDARTGYLFDHVTLPAAVVVAVAALLAGDGMRAAGGVALLVGLFGALVALSRGRLMGLGDVKAMYAMGAAFGPAESAIALFAACISGIATALVAGRMRRGAEIRFGPHLAFGSIVTAAAGDAVAHRLGIA